MSNFSLRLPDNLMEEAKTLAKGDSVSLNQFFLAAISEKMGELKTKHFFQERSKDADIEKALSLLKRVPDTALREGDELP